MIGYDAAGQIKTLVNDVAARRNDRFGGHVEQEFFYDDLSRLVGANGTWTRPEGGHDHYDLTMVYDDIHNITHKSQRHEVTTRGEGHPIEQHRTTYDWDYLAA